MEVLFLGYNEDTLEFYSCFENKGGWHIMAGGMTSFYYSIAVDMARRISKEEFSIGATISGRTVLASQYHVPPKRFAKQLLYCEMLEL